MTIIKILPMIIALAPLLACLTIVLLGAKVLREKSHWPAIVGCGVAHVAALVLLFLAGNPHFMPQKEQVVWHYRWAAIPPVDVPLVDLNPGGFHAEKPAGDQAAGDAKVQLPQQRLSPPVTIDIGLRVDRLSTVMLAMLTFVATLVAIYGAGYMHGDRSYWRFFAKVSLFVFSMIMLVFSPNFVQLFVFWEAVGLCSYLLIGFWYEKPSAATAGKKAFLVNRIGDLGFATGVFLVWKTFGTLDFSDIFIPSVVHRVDTATLTFICLCLFAGAVGKSAQFPLHVWLPDAMEGPTPVSALIHAATMVTAGVFMVARCSMLYVQAPDAQVFVSFIGGFTALLAALIALTQTDLKRVLAYSTVSQLGYMFLSLGTGSFIGVTAAMFHLVTHAFFKALLFLGAGSVMHAMGGVIDMREFSGLRKLMPHTYRTFLIGSLALAGFPLLSGFWSKDAILSALWDAGHPAAHHASAESKPASTETTAKAGAAADHVHGADHAHGANPGHSSEKGHGATSGEGHHAGPKLAAAKLPDEMRLFGGTDLAGVYQALFWMATLTAFLTAFYTFRAFFMTFHGEEKIPHAAGHHAHESPANMTIPLYLLAVGAALLGLLLGHVTGLFDSYLQPVVGEAFGVAGEGVHHPTNWFVVVLSSLVGMAGIGLAYVMYGQPSPWPAKLSRWAGSFRNLSLNKFYLDEVYYVGIVMPLRGVAQVLRLLDWVLLDRMIVDGIGRLPGRVLGRSAQPMHNGLVQFYALSMTLATAVLLVALLWRQG